MADKKELIYKSGEKIFSELGFKDTNVSKITKDAGIGVGTFYSYYDSKEELFMEIFLDRNNRLKKKVLEKVDIESEPMMAVTQMMSLNNEEMLKDPILRMWYDREAYQKVEKKFVEQKGLEEVSFVYDFYLDVIRKWQDEGKMRGDIDTELIMAMFAALINIDMHKDEIGVKFFPEIMNWLAGFIIDGLTNNKKEER